MARLIAICDGPRAKGPRAKGPRASSNHYYLVSPHLIKKYCELKLAQNDVFLFSKTKKKIYKKSGNQKNYWQSFRSSVLPEIFIPSCQAVAGII